MDAVLGENDAYRALQKTGGLIVTGPTGTNVNEVAVVLTGVAAVGVGIFELIRLHVPQGLVLLGGGLVCLGLCARLYLLMKLLTVGTVKLCKWVWIGIKSLFVGKKAK